MTEVLRSAAGLAASAAVYSILLLGALVLFREAIVREEGRAPGDRVRPAATLAALIAAAALVVPLVFTVAIPDTFTLPKVTTLRLILVAGLIAFVAASPPPHSATSDRRDRGLELAVLAYAALTILATLASVDPVHSLEGEPGQYQGLFTTLLYVAFMLLARLAISTPGRAQWLFRAAVTSAAVVTAYGVAQWAGLDPIWDVLPEGRVFSTFGQPNAMAAWLVLALPLGVVIAAELRGVWRLGVASALVLILIGVALTLSRGGYVGVVVGALTLIVACRRDIQRPRLPRRLAGLVGAAAVALVFALVSLGSQAERVIERAALIGDLTEGSTTMRLDLWRVGLSIAIDRPLLGAGPETYPIVFASYRDRALPPEEAARFYRYRPESPHSVPIAIAAGVGIPALALYLGIVASVALRLYRLARGPDPRSIRWLGAAILAAIAAHVVTDMFVTAEIASSWLFWVLLGAGVSLTSVADPPGRLPRLTPAASELHLRGRR